MNNKKSKVTAIILFAFIVIVVVVIAIVALNNSEKLESNNTTRVGENKTSELDKTEQSKNPEADNLNPETIYAAVLENYKRIYLTADWDEYSDNYKIGEYNTDIINSLIIAPGYSPEALYYSFVDLSDDCLPELILCNEYDEIYDIFGYENGEVKRLFELSSFLLNRAYFHIMDSNTICFGVYPGAAHFSIHFYRLKKETAVPEAVQTLSTEETEHFVKNGEIMRKITEEEYNTILDSYGESIVLPKHILAVKETEDN